MRPADRDPGIMTTVTDPARAPLPPDPAQYDAPRAERARARGLDAPYIPGGQAPDADRARREERFYLRLLAAMVIVVVLSGFVIGIVFNLLGLPQ
jgi:hypothetical protein